MRSSLVCLFVSSLPMLFIVFSLRFYICCYLIADVIHCTLCSGFFVISISLRFHRHLDYQFVLFLIIGVLSFLFCFSFPGMRGSFSVSRFPHGRCFFIAFFIAFITSKKFLPASIVLAFRFAFAGLSFIVSSLLPVFFYRFTSHFCVAETLL